MGIDDRLSSLGLIADTLQPTRSQFHQTALASATRASPQRQEYRRDEPAL
jgi:hypothetical protein